MASLYASDEDEAAGAQNDPKPNNKQVSYRHFAFITLKIRRASEQTSPQVARAAGHPAQRVNAAG